MGRDGEPLEHIAIGNVVPFATPSADAAQAASAPEPEAGAEAGPGLVEGSSEAAPAPRTGSVELLEAAARIAAGLVSIGLAALSEAIAGTLPVETAPGPEDEGEAEAAPPAGPDPISLAVGATLGLALEAGRVASEVASDLTRRAERLLSWVPVPGLARAPMHAAGDRVSALNERWRDEQPAAQELATAFARSLVPQVVEAVLDQIDLTELVVDRVDLARIVDELDIDRIIERIDLDGIIARVDVDAIIQRVDLDRIIERIDVDRIVDRIDIAKVVEKIPLDEIVARLDLDGIVARVDLDAILQRLDLAGIAQEVVDEIDLPAIIRDSSSTMATETVDGLRAQTMNADDLVSRAVDKVLRRRRARGTDASAERSIPSRAQASGLEAPRKEER